jgi:hypothetical protein
MRDETLGVLDGGWFLATIMLGVVWLLLWSVFVGSAFYPDMPGENAALTSLNLRIGIALGVCAAMFGGWWYSRYRRLDRITERTQRQRAFRRLIGIHRIHAALLLGLFIPAMLVHTWNIRPWLGGVSLFAIVVALGVGYRAAPAMLAFIAGESPQGSRIAAGIDQAMLAMMGLIGVISSVLAQGVSPTMFFLSLLFVLNVIGTPWIVALLTWAAIYFQAGDDAPTA